MRPRDLLAYLRDTVLRMLPHRAPTGLLAIGNPGRDSPVLLTCNFSLTVRRLREVLRGRDAWLLCANSNGINVWCAAGGGHLTHHDVISVLRTSGIADCVDHRDLILPQLAATGVERGVITRTTGWNTRWGPARLEDLPAFLDHRRRVKKAMRKMTFPLWERLEMATMWTVPTLAIGCPLVAILAGWPVAVAVALAVAVMVGLLFGLLPWLRVTGRGRWPTFGAFAAIGAVGAVGLLHLLGGPRADHDLLAAVMPVVAMAVVSVDLAGTTPWYGSYINTWHNDPRVELLADRCTAAADCVQVCPRDVLQMAGKIVAVKRPENCLQCGACIVQCPEDALRFRYPDGRVVEPATVRTTRMNMLGRRTVPVRDGNTG